MQDSNPEDNAPSPALAGFSIRSLYPDHQSQLSRLAKIDGQIKGIVRMIEERRYCIDIAVQIKAVQSALKQVQMGVLEKHLHHCVADAATGGDAADLGEKIEEIVRVVGKLD